MKRILVTGASGFVGKYLLELLSEKGEFDILGTSLTGRDIEKDTFKKNIRFTSIDLLSQGDVERMVVDFHPDMVVHLAAASSPKESFDKPAETFEANVLGQLNLLEAIRKNKIELEKFLVISSAEVYGKIRPEDLPVNEQAPLRPMNPYAVSKIAQDFLGLQYFLTYKINCIRVRPFNHIGPGQRTGFVVSDFCKQIAEIEKGIREPVIVVGNLDAKRDFTDVRDVVRAYYLLMGKSEAGEVYNIGSGKSRSAKEILETLLKKSEVKIEIRVDKDKLRPSDVGDIVCDYGKINSVTGWKPTIDIEQSLSDSLDYWRKLV